MKRTRRYVLALILGFATLMTIRPATIRAAENYRLSGPYAHQNLAVYLLHSDKRDDRDFITLNEGLKSGQVKVTELENEQVARLRIENQSDKPLFLQEGDRVTGGKQDRTLPTDGGPRADRAGSAGARDHRRDIRCDRDRSARRRDAEAPAR